MKPEDKVKALQQALDRLIRFNKALIHMGAVETPKALDVELSLAFDVLEWSKG